MPQKLVADDAIARREFEEEGKTPHASAHGQPVQALPPTLGCRQAEPRSPRTSWRRSAGRVSHCEITVGKSPSLAGVLLPVC
ncbi:hypothetical protein ACU4HD_44110 [Cupriavidus basilensis]